jgi:hypothetical protein
VHPGGARRHGPLSVPPHPARLQTNRARALTLLAASGDGRVGQSTAARLLIEAGATADRLGTRALATEASELLIKTK